MQKDLSCSSFFFPFGLLKLFDRWRRWCLQSMSRSHRRRGKDVPDFICECFDTETQIRLSWDTLRNGDEEFSISVNWYQYLWAAVRWLCFSYQICYQFLNSPFLIRLSFFYYWRPLFDRSPHTIPWQFFSSLFIRCSFFSNVFLEWIFVTIMSSITASVSRRNTHSKNFFVYFSVFVLSFLLSLKT